MFAFIVMGVSAFVALVVRALWRYRPV